MRGDGSSSQNRRGAAEEWRRGEDHYNGWDPSKDKQRRGARDDYDPSAWTPSKDPDYSQQRQWKQPHEADYAFHDNAGWVPRTTDTSRDISYNNQWSPPREERVGGGHQEQRGRSRWDARERPRDSGWNRNNPTTANNNASNPKKEPVSKEFQSDNGWESRRRTNAPLPPSDDTIPKPFTQEEDRNWEPAASWRSNHKDSGGSGNNANNPANSNANNHRQGKQGQRKHQNRNKGGKNKKQNQTGQQKQKQDWRNEDSNPNKYVLLFFFPFSLCFLIRL